MPCLSPTCCILAPESARYNWLQNAIGHPTLAAYFERLMERPSFARVFEEAEPYRHMFPAE